MNNTNKYTDIWQNLPMQTGKLNAKRLTESQQIQGGMNEIYQIDIGHLFNLQFFLNQHNRGKINDITQYNVGDVLNFKYDQQKGKIKIFGAVGAKPSAVENSFDLRTKVNLSNDDRKQLYINRLAVLGRAVDLVTTSPDWTISEVTNTATELENYLYKK